MALPIIAGSYLYRSTTVVDNTGVAISEMPRWVEWLPFILLCIGLLIGFPCLLWPVWPCTPAGERSRPMKPVYAVGC